MVQLRIAELATGDILPPKSRNFGTRATGKGEQNAGRGKQEEETSGGSASLSENCLVFRP